MRYTNPEHGTTMHCPACQSTDCECTGRGAAHTHRCVACGYDGSTLPEVHRA